MLFMKKLKYFISLMLCLFFTFSMTGCFWKSKDEVWAKREQEIIATFEKDDTFYYALDEVADTYHISGKVNELPQTLYTPVQFNGKGVSRLTHIAFTGVSSLLSRDFTPFEWLSDSYEIENLYISDNIEIKNRRDFSDACSVNVFFSFEEVENIDFPIFTYHQKSSYVTEKVFDYLVTEKAYEYIIRKHDHYCIELQNSNKITCFVQKANVTFYYNNNSAKNKIFLVDNKDGAFLINKPQYDPILKGYEFAGWYKEPECINKWNFETDKTPELQYDENNELIFVETKLYAKWI